MYFIQALRTSFEKHFVTRSKCHKGFCNISRTQEVARFVLQATILESALKLAVSNSSLARWQVLGVCSHILPALNIGQGNGKLLIPWFRCQRQGSCHNYIDYNYDHG